MLKVFAIENDIQNLPKELEKILNMPGLTLEDKWVCHASDCSRIRLILVTDIDEKVAAKAEAEAVKKIEADKVAADKVAADKAAADKKESDKAKAEKTKAEDKQIEVDRRAAVKKANEAKAKNITGSN